MKQNGERNSGSNDPVFRFSVLPDAYKPSARNLVGQFDTDGDGCIDAGELANVVEALKNIFGVSVAAAHLAKDTKIDDDSGFLMTKNKNSVAKTGEALTLSSTDRFVDLDNEDLRNLKYLSLTSADVHFHVKGYERSSSGEEVILLVEGGTLTFKDTIGLSTAIGDALFLLEEAAGVDFENVFLEEEITKAPVAMARYVIITRPGIR